MHIQPARFPTPTKRNYPLARMLGLLQEINHSEPKNLQSMYFLYFWCHTLLLESVSEFGLPVWDVDVAGAKLNDTIKRIKI